MKIDYEEARKWHEETFKGTCELNSDNERVYNAIQSALIMAQKSDAPNKIWAVDYNGQKIWEEVGEFAPFHHMIEGDWEIKNVTAYIKYSEYVKLHDKHYGTPCEQVRERELKELLSRAKSVIDEYIGEAGGCDHKVGLCMCEPIHFVTDISKILGEEDE